MNKKVLLIVILFVGLIILVTLSLATPKNTKDQPTLPQTDIAENTTLTLPDEVIANFSTYPDVTVSKAEKTVREDGKIFYSLRLDTKDDIETVNSWYKEALSTNGWSIKSDQNVGGYRIIQAEKDNLYTSMQASRNDDTGIVSISQQSHIKP